ncbi:MAG TPA: UTP--glucose-1-phosphate uridylyltransferase GalU [Burkholderiaceae bacterium]|nr:UTP--glucose-1-phosphate uridylyltransferase GalU [Burkholderiaceae bacterium]
MQLKKAVFPVAGLGTRFLPATKSIPKEMLPIVDRPIIQYAVDEAIEAGCDTLIFVTGRSKRAVEDYFDRNPELEAELEAKGKHEALSAVRDIIPSHVKVLFVRQPAPLGLGHAVLCAAPMIGPDEHFAVLLPDDLIDGYPEGVLRQMLPFAESTGGSVVAVEQVPRGDVDKYGIVAPIDEHGPRMRINAIVEKPPVDEAPSTYAVVGRYILHPDVMKTLVDTEPGAGGEIQLTDALAAQIESPGLHGYRFSGKRFDCGNKQGFLTANIYFGLR